MGKQPGQETLGAIRPVSERRSGAPLPAPSAGDTPADAYDYPVKRRRRPETTSTGVIKCSFSLPEATRLALERARIQEGMPPLSEIVNRALVEYLRRNGVIA